MDEHDVHPTGPPGRVPAVRPLDPVTPERPPPGGGPVPLVVAVLVAVGLLIVLLVAIGPGDGEPPTTAASPPTAPVEEAVVLTAPDGRFEVTYPASWTLADEDLTPNAGVGPELFAVGTFEMTPGGPCPRQPKQALDDLGPGDAFVWVEERPGTTTNGPRPASFTRELSGIDEGTDPVVCMDVAERADLGVLRWIAFTDQGSDFYAIMAVGREAPASLVSQAGAVLDSFTPAPFEQAAEAPVPIDIPGAAVHRPLSAGMIASPDWEVVDPGPVIAQAAAIVAWTGDEIVTVGIRPVGDAASQTGLSAFDPAAGTWRDLAPSPVAGRPPDVATLWTGAELLAWNGDGAAAWDPGTDTWRTIPDWPLLPTTHARAVWTGNEVIDIDAALTVDPLTGMPRPIAPAPAVDERAAVVWAAGQVVVVPDGAAYDASDDVWIRTPGSGLTPLATDAVWTGAEVFAADYELGAAGYDPSTDVWTPYPDLPLRFVECFPAAHVVQRRPLVEHCGGVALWDPAAAHWLPVAPPNLYSGGLLVSTGDAVYSVGSAGVHRLAPAVLESGPRRLAVGGGLLDIPQGWAVASTSAEAPAGPADAGVVSIELARPGGARCSVRAVAAPAATVIRPFLVPGHQVATLDFAVGGEPSEVVAVPLGGHDGRHHYVWAISDQEVMDVGCTDGRHTPVIARRLWSPWQDGD